MGSKKSKPTRPNRTSILPKKPLPTNKAITTVRPAPATVAAAPPPPTSPIQRSAEPVRSSLTVQRPLPIYDSQPYRQSLPPQTPRPLIDPKNDLNPNSPLLSSMLTYQPTSTPPPQYEDIANRASLLAPPAPVLPPPPSLASTTVPVYQTPLAPSHLVEPEKFNIAREPHFDSNYQPFRPPLPFDMDPYYKQKIIPNDDYYRRSENFSTACQKYRLNMITLE